MRVVGVASSLLRDARRASVNDRPVVALDAMGGDFAPHATVAGALEAARAGVRVLLVGDEAVLAQELRACGGALQTAVRIMHAPDAIGMGEHAAAELRRRRGSSVYVAMELVQRGEAAAAVTLGNTGAGLAAALLVFGRLSGVERPALVVPLPTPRGVTLLLDAGANAENRPSHLVQFAHLGAGYMRAVMGVTMPRVGLLNVGEESGKGSSLTIATHAALSRAALRFIGNVEGRDIAAHVADVLVTDGFTGNVALKVFEGTAALLRSELRSAASTSWRARLGGLLLRPALQAAFARADHRMIGAVPLLGVDGLVFIGHGRSDPRAVASALRSAADAAGQGLHQALRDVAREASVAAEVLRVHERSGDSVPGTRT